MDWCRLGSKEHKTVPLTYDFLLTFSLFSHIFILCHQTIPGMSSLACLIAPQNIGNRMNCRWLGNLFSCGLSSWGNRKDSYKYTRGGDLWFYTRFLWISSWILKKHVFLWPVVVSQRQSPVLEGFQFSQNARPEQHHVCLTSQQRMRQLVLKHVDKFVLVECF